jgi:hypothetical protein
MIFSILFHILLSGFIFFAFFFPALRLNLESLFVCLFL